VQVSFKLPSEILEAGVPAKGKPRKEENWRNSIATKETAPEVGA